LSDPAITVEGLRKAYGQNEAVRGIDFEVASGEVFGFLGTNGAGKTTTIEILEGYRQRTGGEANVLGVDPARPTRAWRERIGLVLQECELDPLLTVRETLELFAAFYSRPRPIDDTVELVGLGEKRDARAGTLSGGQKRRVDVAVALIGDPDLVFLDEPTTGFDPSARRESWNMIEGLKALGKTIFLTTHYMDEAQHLSDRVAILRRGEIVATGRPEDLSAGGQGRATGIRFRLPNGVSVDAVRAHADAPVEVSGNEVAVKTDKPQRTLYRLTGWAESEGLELAALDVRRPSLEDVFLELTSGGNTGGDAALVLRETRFGLLTAVRNPRVVVFSIAFPVVLLVLFNSIFTSGADKTTQFSGGTISTDAYFTAGMTAYSIMMSAFTTILVGLTTQRESGQLKRLRGTPMPAWTFIAAQVLRSIVLVVAMVTALLLIGHFAFDVDLHSDTVVGLIVYVGLGTATMASLGIALTVVTPTADAASTIGPFTAVILSFISGVFIPVETLPNWLESIGRVFPLFHLADGLQATLASGTSGTGLGGDNVAVLAIWGVAGLVTAARHFPWEPQASRG
jgi:ABC-2 type transport system ATP-binding protein